MTQIKMKRADHENKSLPMEHTYSATGLKSRFFFHFCLFCVFLFVSLDIQVSDGRNTEISFFIITGVLKCFESETIVIFRCIVHVLIDVKYQAFWLHNFCRIVS